MSSCDSPCIHEKSNPIFDILIKTLLEKQCEISPPEKWPKDYGPTAIEKGLKSPIKKLSKILNFIFIFIKQVWRYMTLSL